MSSLKWIHSGNLVRFRNVIRKLFRFLERVSETFQIVEQDTENIPVSGTFYINFSGKCSENFSDFENMIQKFFRFLVRVTENFLVSGKCSGKFPVSGKISLFQKWNNFRNVFWKCKLEFLFPNPYFLVITFPLWKLRSGNMESLVPGVSSGPNHVRK